MAASYATLTGNTARATAAMRVFNTTALANPFVMLTTLAASAAAAYLLFKSSAEKATAAQAEFNAEANEEVQSQMEVKAAINGRLNMLKQLKTSDEVRLGYLRKLRQEYAEYLPELENEKGTIYDIIKLQETANQLLDHRIMRLKELAIVNTFEEKMTQFVKDRIKLEENLYETQEKRKKLNQELDGKDVSPQQAEFLKAQLIGLEAINNQALVELDRLEDEYVKKFNSIRSSLYNIFREDPEKGEGSGSSGGMSPEQLKALKELQAKIDELNREAELKLMEANEREIQLIRDKYKTLLEAAKGFAKETAALTELMDNEIAAKRTEQEAARVKAAEDYMNKIRQESLEDRYKREKEYADELHQSKILDRESYLEALEHLHQAHLDRVHQMEETERREKDRLLRRTGTRTSDQQYQFELAELEAALNKKLISEEEFLQAREALQMEYRDRLRRIVSDETFSRNYDIDLLELQSALEKELLTHEEFLRAKKLLDLEYENAVDQERQRLFNLENQRMMQRLSVAAQSSAALLGMVTSLKDMELDRIEVVERRQNESEEEFTKRKEQEEAQRLQIARDYAYAEALMKVSSIISTTALAIMRQYSDLPLPLAKVSSVIVGATGLVQSGAAIAEAQKIRGYEDGRYPVLDQKNRKWNAGMMQDAATGKITDPMILVGEKPEIIIDPATTKHLEMNYPEVIETIYQSASRMRGYETGHYPKPATPATPDAPKTDPVFIYLADSIDKLNKRLDDGIQAHYGESEVRQMRARLEKLEQIKNNRVVRLV
ncbi:MAG: hypothetical protein LAT81_14055 [Oceanicaulis sp.]|nr:hypothetical protein [Oceanicaulis sp.]